MPSLSQTQHKAKVNAAKERDTALRKSIDNDIVELASAVDRVRASERFEAYLRTQAVFHDYSWHNCMLIGAQCPTATQVAGFQTWKKLKRHVRKGQKSIRIFAPCPWKKEKSDGTTETGVWFKCVSVFDVSQTDGEALPEVECPTIDVASDRLLADLCSVTTSRGIALSFGPIVGGAYGVSKKGSIEVDNTHTTGQQAKTLAHELAHEALHWEVKGSFTRSLAELEAESVAFIVCKRFGLDTSVRSSAYIALWDGDAKSLRASLDRISKTARDIIDSVESARKASKAVA